jgi:hypothetical protein
VLALLEREQEWQELAQAFLGLEQGWQELVLAFLGRGQMLEGHQNELPHKLFQVILNYPWKPPQWSNPD